ncbi:MAG: hypothetical protein QXF35_01310 [Candidatus Bilamarchaeaceae archaeon]
MVGAQNSLQCNGKDTEDPCAYLSPQLCQALKYFEDWKVAALLALIISTLIVAIAYMMGAGFEMPDLKAWATNEISQLIATAIIIAAVIGVFTLLDGIVLLIVQESRVPNLSCAIGENCLNKTASFYLDDYISTAKEGALEAYKKVIEEIQTTTTRYNIYCSQVITPIPCLQIGSSIPREGVGNAILNSERETIVYEYYQGLLASMEAQKFFVSKVAFGVGPLLLAMGVLGRAFFFTRRLGGLLIAVAIGIMFVFPLMYIFDWLTMQLTLYGDLPFSGFSSNCPLECQKTIPVAYMDTTGKFGGAITVQFNNTGELMNLIFDEINRTKKCSEKQNMKEASEIAAKLTSGEIEKYILPYSKKTIVSCEGEASKAVVKFTSKKMCIAEGESEDEIDYSLSKKKEDCPEEDEEKNYTCPLQCRVLPYPYWIPKCAEYGTQLACSKLTEKCKIIRFVEKVDTFQNNSCPAECKIIPPLKNDCSSAAIMTSFCPARMESPCTVDACLDSRFDCRSKYRTKGTPFKDWFEKLTSTSKENPEVALIALEKCSFATTCAGFDFKADNTNNYKNTLDIAKKSCIYIYPDPNNPSCSGCVFTEKAYLYDPVIRPDDECKDLCSSKPTGKKQTGANAPLLVEGNVGPTILTDVAKLLVPVYLLPLFNILVTVMFIRSFSRFLGGDIEIPGLAKVL